MSFQNLGAWIAQKGARISVGTADYPQADDNSVIIKNEAVAVNPLDHKMQDYGILVRAWPTILGRDVAGEIVAVGKNVTSCRVGQRALGLAVSLVTDNLTQSGFQLYTAVPANVVTHVPDTLDAATAAVLPLSVSCAAAGLYDPKGLNLSLPSSKLLETGQTLLVWGASSSVGCSTIQLAHASGIKVVATASPQNFAQVQKLGAWAVFDYNDPAIEEKLFAALDGTNCVGAYDTIGTNMAKCVAVISRLGGGHVAGTLEPPDQCPENVITHQVYATSVKDNHIGAAIFQQYLPSALRDGTFVPYPAPTITGHGLEQIQSAIDRLKQGVSASKLVVTL